MQHHCQPHVLLAEDNDFNRQLAGAVLAEQGYRVTEAEDGERAVALFRAQQFDLILMDIGMPRMDGYEATRAIRSMEETRGGRTLVIALTAHDGPEARQACLDSGMDDMLVKPVSGKKLAECIARCGQKNLSGVGPVVAETAAKGEAACPSMASEPFQTLFSDRILTDFGSSPERLQTYFDLLCHDLEAQIALMDAAYKAGDSAALRDAAHAAKGVASGLRDQSLRRLAGEIEGQAQRSDLSGVKERLTDAMKLFQALRR